MSPQVATWNGLSYDMTFWVVFWIKPGVEGDLCLVVVVLAFQERGHISSYLLLLWVEWGGGGHIGHTYKPTRKSKYWKRESVLPRWTHCTLTSFLSITSIRFSSPYKLRLHWRHIPSHSEVIKIKWTSTKEPLIGRVKRFKFSIPCLKLKLWIVWKYYVC